MSVYLGTEKISVYTGGQPTIQSGQYVWAKYEIIPCLGFIGNEDFTLKTFNNAPSWDGVLEYSTDTTTWSTWDGTNISSSDGKLYLRGIGNTRITHKSNMYRFVFTGTDTLKITCEGNIESLLDYATVSAGNHPTMANYCYAYMFFGCTYLTVAPSLPATTLANYCYQSMFADCTSLTTPPELPATTLANYCYIEMFSNCTALTKLPALPATTLAERCYSNMFRDCSNIKLSTEQTGDYQTAYRIPTSGTGITGTNSLNSMFAGTGGTFTGTPEINTTYYTSNTVV